MTVQAQLETPPVEPVSRPERTPVLLSAARFGDYVQLTKPRLTSLVVLTTLVGYLFAPVRPIDALQLFQTVAATLLVAAAAGALNQLAERNVDAAMRRTARRPLPAGRLTPTQALLFGGVLLITGAAWLAFAVNALSSLLAVLTAVFYLGFYTPLKRISPVATLVGAVPGAIPPMIGWAAATGGLEPGAWALFGILFLWQMPHFLAIAALFRADYAAAGFRVLSVIDPGGGRTGRQALFYALALIPVSIAPALLGLAGPLYIAAALLLGAWYAWRSFELVRRPGDLAAARKLFRVSLLYLPALLFLLVTL